MKKILSILSVVLLAVSCKVELTNPYENSTFEVKVKVAYPEGFEEYMRSGLDVTATDINLGNSYTDTLETDGTVTFTLPNGIYNVKMSDKVGGNIFNASVSKFIVNGSAAQLELPVKLSVAGSLIIKEIYCGGCTIQPSNSLYQADKYLIIHNNDFEVQYLDGLCMGTTYPYNAAGSNPFLDTAADGSVSFRSYVAVSEALWSFPGDGDDFPLGPGEDAVLCLCGAIDHSALYPQSVNLNNKDYFVCYDNNAYTNEHYHPTPGTEIQKDHYMKLVEKVGVANAYTFSVNSPAVILYRVKDMTPEEYVETTGSTISIPGSSSSRVVVVPNEWVIDAVEVFYGGTSDNKKRFPSDLDAGKVYLSSTGLGHTLMRKTDEESTAAAGYEVLIDTNDSSNDFYERETQSLHD